MPACVGVSRSGLALRAQRLKGVMSSAVWIAFALLLLLEGLPLLVTPARWREVVRRVSSLADGQLRFFGLLMVLIAGAVLLYSARN